MKSHKIYIGTSGWSYKHWRGTFYPEKLKVKDEFKYYSERFDTVELNSPFYRLPKPETMQMWKDNVSDSFVYVLKASRFITHMKKLNDPVESIRLFFDRAEILKDKVGAILFQLPPNLLCHYELLENFLSALPEDFRYVFEFRNADWYRDEIYSLLRKYNCAFCVYELNGHHSPIEVTADFAYVRLHGPGGKYQGSYSDQTLSEWADLCKEWLATKDVFFYFDNDQEGFAAFNAMRLKELVAS
ncbi:MAG: DUF72 domain-containing protein [Flavobacterium sp.]|nr:MAG: DUF72 domain-containing protein [Flavobacterium sp.]